MFGDPQQYPVVVHVRVCARAHVDVHVYYPYHAPVDVDVFACAVACVHGSALQMPGSILRGVSFGGSLQDPKHWHG